MDTKSFEVMIHSQYAFDACREQVYAYEDCRQTNTPVPRNPAECKTYSKQVLDCYKESEKMDPICVLPFNDSRECLFKADGNLYNCKEWVNLYVNCQKNPRDYKQFLEASSKKQLDSKSFDFVKNRGHYDKYI